MGFTRYPRNTRSGLNKCGFVPGKCDSQAELQIKGVLKEDRLMLGYNSFQKKKKKIVQSTTLN